MDTGGRIRKYVGGSLLPCKLRSRGFLIPAMKSREKAA